WMARRLRLRPRPRRPRARRRLTVPEAVPRLARLPRTHSGARPSPLARESAMSDRKHFQLIVVGTGPGGYVAAIRAAQLGLKTAVVEKDELGGTCLNWGCIPTKAWIVTAHLYEQIRRAKEYGIEVGEPKIDWGALVARKNKVVKQLTGGVGTLLKGRGVEIFKGAAKLTGPNQMTVTGAGAAQELSADHVLIATGAQATLPPGFKLDGERVITSQQALDL